MKKLKPETQIRNLKNRVKDLEELCHLAGIPMLIVVFPELALQKKKQNITKEDIKWAKEKIAKLKKNKEFKAILRE